MIQLRPDQQDVEQRTYEAWNNGARNVLAVAATGWGKSVYVSEIALKKHLLGSVQVKIAHRNELVGQLSGHLARRGIAHRVIAPRATVSGIVADHRNEFGRSFVNPDANCSVAGVDTLLARSADLASWAQQVDHWTIDEAHHVLAANKWGRATAMFPNAYGLGVTASPTRADGGGLGRHADGVFDVMVEAPPMRWLIDHGMLSEYEIVIPKTDFYINEDDFTTATMREASKRSHIVGDVVTEYVKYAYGKRGICFATDVETAGEIATRFNAWGIPAAAISVKTPAELRTDYIRRFRSGQLWMLVNVDLFGEGFDVPAVEVVIMARPTASLAVYLQQFGRALRVFPGKAFGLVIDLVSNWKRHKLPDKPHHWTLDRREKRGKREKDPEEIELTVCRGCSRPYERFHVCCPHCGWTPPLPDPAVRSLEQIDGDLMLLDRARLAAMRANIELESPASVAQRVGAAAGDLAGRGALNRSMEKHAAQQRLRAAIDQWAGIQRFKGRSDQESYRRFYMAAGVDVLSALSADRSRTDMEALAGKVESWCGL